MFRLLLSILVLSNIGTVMSFRPSPCQRNDYKFKDGNDCTKYFRCSYGKPYLQECPPGQQWSTARDRCDYPEHSDCGITGMPGHVKEPTLNYNGYTYITRMSTLDSENATMQKAITLDKPVLLYMTFDDGPWGGTTEVLDALKEFNVRATFCINSMRFIDPVVSRQAQNKRNLIRIVNEGHTLADHSFDHMQHNTNNGPHNVYLDVEHDLSFFGKMNIYPPLEILREANFDDETIDTVMETMSRLVRMPYSNNWRVTTREGRVLQQDCVPCTVPEDISGENGLKIANLLASKGKEVFGWDYEWNGPQFGILREPKAFLHMIGDGRNVQSEGKVVILTHDNIFSYGEAKEQLREFLKLALDSGYEFRTLDTYYKD